MKLVKGVLPIDARDVWDTPLNMWNSFIDYRNYVIENPFLDEDFYGKDAVSRFKQKIKPLTIQAFSAYCQAGWRTFDRHNKLPEFEEVCEVIKANMSGYNIDGAAANMLSPLFISKIEGLVDRKEISGNSIQTVVFHVPKPLKNIDAEEMKLLMEGDEEAWEV